MKLIDRILPNNGADAVPLAGTGAAAAAPKPSTRSRTDACKACSTNTACASKKTCTWIHTPCCPHGCIRADCSPVIDALHVRRAHQGVFIDFAFGRFWSLEDGYMAACRPSSWASSVKAISTQIPSVACHSRASSSAGIGCAK